MKTEDYISPVVMERVMRPIAGDPEQDEYDMIEITHAQTKQLLATCMIGDDASVERIADLLSAKRLWREANRLRGMVQDSRRRKRVEA
jgi:hypothetical protein